MSETLRICRRILRELQKSDAEARTGQLWQYIRTEIVHTKNERETINGHEDERMTNKHDLLRTYCTYLESSRQHRDLLERYQGRGERSVEDTAKLVGMKLPENKFKDDIIRENDRTAS